MKIKSFLILLLSLGVFVAMRGPVIHAENTPKTLTLLYSNNFNGETDPCPT